MTEINIQTFLKCCAVLVIFYFVYLFMIIILSFSFNFKAVSVCIEIFITLIIFIINYILIDVTRSHDMYDFCIVSFLMDCGSETHFCRFKT